MSLQLDKEKNSIKAEVEQFISTHIHYWIQDTVQSTMISLARAANLPKQFIDSIELQSTSDGSQIINDWVGDKGEPFYKWFEYGTKDHWVEPLPGGVLAFVAKGAKQQKHAKAIFFQSSGVKKGNVIFSKGHYVSGIPGFQPMTRGYKKGMEKLKRKVKSEVKQFSKELQSKYNVRAET